MCFVAIWLCVLVCGNATPCSHVRCYRAPLIVAHAQIRHIERGHKNMWNPESLSHRFDGFFQSRKGQFLIFKHFSILVSSPSLSLPSIICFWLHLPSLVKQLRHIHSELKPNTRVYFWVLHASFAQLRPCLRLSFTNYVLLERLTQDFVFVFNNGQQWMLVIIIYNRSLPYTDVNHITVWIHTVYLLYTSSV